MAGDQALPPNDSVGQDALYILVPLFVFAVVLYATRIYTRLGRKGRLSAADYAITVAMAMEAIVLAFASVAVARGFGRRSAYLGQGDFEAIAFNLYITYLFGVWASCAARISVAFLLLEISTSLVWKAVLRAAIASQLALGLATNIAELLQCRPVEANWRHVDGAVCFSQAQQLQYAFAFIAITMVADAVFAALPVYMIWKLRRPALEKLLVSVLMTLSVFALAAGAFKIYYINLLDFGSPEILREAVTMYTWIRVEEAAIIVAACAPLLKVPIENALHRLGLPRFSNPIPTLIAVQTSSGDSEGALVSKGSTARPLSVA